MAVDVIQLSDAAWPRHDFYMRLALVVESGAKCLGSRVGAVIVRDNRVLGRELCELAGGAHINQIARLAGLDQLGQFGRRNRCYAHDFRPFLFGLPAIRAACSSSTCRDSPWTSI